MKKLLLILTFLLMFFNLKILFSQNIIYHFDNEVNLNEWVIVNDDVMGGVSKSNLNINKDGNGVFGGKISINAPLNQI
jgi:NADH dehydrogenase [ubiquinone] 1 alpha subcomplex assembly factor 1